MRCKNIRKSGDLPRTVCFITTDKRNASRTFRLWLFLNERNVTRARTGWTTRRQCTHNCQHVTPKHHFAGLASLLHCHVSNVRDYLKKAFCNRSSRKNNGKTRLWIPICLYFHREWCFENTSRHWYSFVKSAL